MIAIDLIKFITSHPEHVATISKLIEVFKSDPTLISDISKLLQDISSEAKK